MKIAARFRNYFFAGILVMAPVGITLWLAWQIVGFVDDRIRPLIPLHWHPETYLPFELPGFGILVVLTALVAILGKLIIKYSAWPFLKIPVISSIYGWTRQVFETLLSEDSTAFREVVLIEYPYRGSWAVGFITGRTEGEIQNLTSETVYNVFVPATPNPTTGFLLFIPERDIRRLDITVDEGIKLVISGGIVKPAADQEQDSIWGSGTGIAKEVERIKMELEAEHPPAEEPARPLSKLRDYLLAGTLVSAPIAITVWLALGIINYFDESVIPLIPAGWNPETYLPFALPGLGLLLAVLSVTLVGFLTAGFLGDAIVRTGERLIKGLPLVRGIYAAVKQIFETLLKKQSDAFREVVLVQYPRPDAWAIGFITGAAASAIQGNTEQDSVNIFLPTTPNPTSGFLLFLPRPEAQALTMTVEEGLKMVVSGGIVTPGLTPPDSEEPADAADASAQARPPDRAGR
jgi:uncharacterized membrane protein